MSQDTICLLGGTGFVGQHLVHSLTGAGYRVRVLTRRRERHRALLVNPAVTLIEADVHSEGALRQQFSECDVVINLVAILNDSAKDGSGFHKVHVELPEKIVAAATNPPRRWPVISATTSMAILSSLVRRQPPTASKNSSTNTPAQ